MYGVQVALQGLVRALAPGLLRRGGPTHTHHVEVTVVEDSYLSVLREDGEQRMRSSAFHLCCNVLQIRNAELLVDPRRDLPAVGVKDRQQRRASVILPDQVLDNDVPQGREQLPGFLRVEVEPLLRLAKTSNGSTFHHVTHEGPGCSGETDDRHLILHPVLRPIDGVENVSQGLLDVGSEVDLTQGLGRGQRKVKLGAGLRHHPAPHAHGHGDHEDVGEYYQRVQAGISAVWLQGHLRD
eukprot:CAMPEP_0179072250 /NCGR_PEP_ID=MMETSP0796-20121207/31957_1 /TAXON_ID=73915 /ORGANISM="Pyrodinium bahamense, Strain pbaha01" /LENGTH=238 /DNA_ID=CAMNT_0020769403 /DNA_START=257 /DNA_END=972 /DNA_ORIENTATION=+